MNPINFRRLETIEHLVLKVLTPQAGFFSFAMRLKPMRLKTPLSVNFEFKFFSKKGMSLLALSVVLLLIKSYTNSYDNLVTGFGV